jgi:DNA-binding GntR family transcriptional regulator
MSKNGRSNLSDRTYETLKRRIIERQIKPGVKLDLPALEEEFQVSRMPILDALTRLEHEGLVLVRNRVGTFVAPLSANLYEDIFEMRIMIEQWITPKIILHISNHDVAQLRALLDSTGQMLDNVTEQDFDYRSFMRCDEEFHLNLIRLSRNAHIIQSYATMNVHIQTARAYSLRALARSREGQAEHEAILEAFAARNVEQARLTQLHHAERSRQGILTLLQTHGEL